MIALAATYKSVFMKEKATAGASHILAFKSIMKEKATAAASQLRTAAGAVKKNDEPSQSSKYDVDASSDLSGVSSTAASGAGGVDAGKGDLAEVIAIAAAPTNNDNSNGTVADITHMLRAEIGMNRNDFLGATVLQCADCVGPGETTAGGGPSFLPPVPPMNSRSSTSSKRRTLELFQPASYNLVH